MWPSSQLNLTEPWSTVSVRAAGLLPTHTGQECKRRPRGVLCKHLEVTNQISKLANFLLSSYLDKYTFQINLEGQVCMQKSSLKFYSLSGQCAARHQPMPTPVSSHVFCLRLSSPWTSAGGHVSPHVLLYPQKQLSFSHSSVLMYNKLQATRGQRQERESRKRMPKAIEAGWELFVWGILETQLPSLQELCSLQQTHHFSPKTCPSYRVGDIRSWSEHRPPFSSPRSLGSPWSHQVNSFWSRTQPLTGKFSINSQFKVSPFKHQILYQDFFFPNCSAQISLSLFLSRMASWFWEESGGHLKLHLSQLASTGFKWNVANFWKEALFSHWTPCWSVQLPCLCLVSWHGITTLSLTQPYLSAKSLLSACPGDPTVCFNWSPALVCLAPNPRDGSFCPTHGNPCLVF